MQQKNLVSSFYRNPLIYHHYHHHRPPLLSLPIREPSLSLIEYIPMAQNFEHFHVPQQNRRNKLRVSTQTNQEPQTPLFSQQILMNPSQSAPYFSHQPPKHMNLYHPTSTSLQGLSLSLSFQLDSQRYNNNAVSSVSGDFLKQSGGGGEMRSSVPFGPFTGYASILKSSRFLKPAQQILDDLCGVINRANSVDVPLDCLRESDVMRESTSFLSDGVVDHQWKNSKLILMLDEVYRRYKLYCQQMQSVVASFEAVAGLGNAAPYICNAIKIVLKHFTCLKSVLLDKIQFTGRNYHDRGSDRKDKSPRFWTAGEQGQVNQNPTTSSLNFIQNPVWRSQRGLPDHAVAVLKTWLFEHFLHPYPTDSEKQALAQQTGLSRTQVSNWFINARVRLWKPMVEEVHMLESQQTQVPFDTVNQNPNLPSYDLPLEKHPLTFKHRQAENIQTKRPRNEFSDVSNQRQDPRNISGNTLTSNHYPAGVGGSNGVSLALGLHQNNGIDLSWPLSVNVPRHVNLEMISMMDSVTATSFKVQNQHFREDYKG